MSSDRKSSGDNKVWAEVDQFFAEKDNIFAAMCFQLFGQKRPADFYNNLKKAYDENGKITTDDLFGKKSDDTCAHSAKTSGKPCGAACIPDSKYCEKHDPERKKAVQGKNKKELPEDVYLFDAKNKGIANRVDGKPLTAEDVKLVREHGYNATCCGKKQDGSRCSLLSAVAHGNTLPYCSRHLDQASGATPAPKVKKSKKVPEAAASVPKDMRLKKDKDVVMATKDESEESEPEPESD